MLQSWMYGRPWATRPYVQRDIGPVVVPSTSKAKQFEAAALIVTVSPDGTKLVKVTIHQDLQVGSAPGGSVRNRFEPPKDEVSEPTFTRATDGSNCTKRSAKICGVSYPQSAYW